MMKIPEYMIKAYKEKTGLELQECKQCETIVNKHGFMRYFLLGDSFWIWDCYGDGKYWDSLAQSLAKKYGCKQIRFYTQRNPKAFERKYGYKIKAFLMEKEVK